MKLAGPCPPHPLPRTGTSVRLRHRKPRGYGLKPVSENIDGVVMVMAPEGVVIRDHDGGTHAVKARNILDFSQFLPGQNDGPLFTADDMALHIRQSGCPAVDMISNPGPRESTW